MHPSHANSSGSAGLPASGLGPRLCLPFSPGLDILARMDKPSRDANFKPKEGTIARFLRDTLLVDYSKIDLPDAFEQVGSTPNQAILTPSYWAHKRLSLVVRPLFLSRGYDFD